MAREIRKKVQARLPQTTVILHVGAGHTGTTTLQSSLARWKGTPDGDVQYAPRYGNHKASQGARGLAAQNYSQEWMTTASEAQLAHLLSSLLTWVKRRRPKYLVCSDESLSGTVSPRQRLQMIGRALAEVGPLRVMMMVSNPVAAAVSVYSNAVLHGFPQAFHAPEVASWPSLDHQFALMRLEALEAESVHVRALDYSRDFLDQYELALEDLCGVGLALPRVTRENPSLTIDHIRSLVVLNGLAGDGVACYCVSLDPNYVRTFRKSHPIRISPSEADVVARAHQYRNAWLVREALVKDAPYLDSMEGAVAGAISQGKVAEGPDLSRVTRHPSRNQITAAANVLARAEHSPECRNATRIGGSVGD